MRADESPGLPAHHLRISRRRAVHRGSPTLTVRNSSDFVWPTCAELNRILRTPAPVCRAVRVQIVHSSRHPYSTLVSARRSTRYKRKEARAWQVHKRDVSPAPLSHG